MERITVQAVIRGLLSGIMLLVICVLWSGCKGASAPPRVIEVPPSPPTKAVTTVTNGNILTPLEDGRVCDLKADSMTWDVEKGIAEMYGVSCAVKKDDRPIYNATAEKGRAIIADKKITVTLSGKVRVTEPTGRATLTADAFRWKSTGKNIEADKVVWVGEGFQHSADKGVFSVNLQDYSFSGHVCTKTIQP